MFNALIRKVMGHKPSKETAKKRLQFALVYDKLEVNDSTLSDLQKDIVEVILKYFEIDKDALQLEVQRDKDVSALVFNTPILNVKRKIRV
ncbi:MAG: cell division topological specificity factor MinE [Pseudomonadota bacterium]